MATLSNLKSAFLPITRVHVTEGFRWGQAAGTDYWLNFNSGFDLMVAASTALGEQLAENGWVATSMVNTAGSGGDAAVVSVVPPRVRRGPRQHHRQFVTDDGPYFIFTKRRAFGWGCRCRFLAFPHDYGARGSIAASIVVPASTAVIRIVPSFCMNRDVSIETMRRSHAASTMERLPRSARCAG